MASRSSMAGISCFIVMGFYTLQLSADWSAREQVELGWHDEFQLDTGWILEPKDQSREAGVLFHSGGAIFSVPASNNPVSWTRTTNPIWPNPFRYLEIRYRIEPSGNPSPSVSILLTDDSTGPITPGALNPENPLAGNHEAQVGPLASNKNRAIFDLEDLFPSDRISRITLQIMAGDASARVYLERLAFWSTDPRKPSPGTAQVSAMPLFAKEESAPAKDPSRNGEWQPLELPDHGTIASTWLASALGTSPDWPDGTEIERHGISFRLCPMEQAAASTGMMEIDAIEIPGSWRGSELALLLATRMTGSDARAFGNATGQPRTEITSPHRLAVRLEYEDGSTTTHLPWSVGHGKWTVAKLPDAYIVPLDCDKTLRHIALVDRMQYGQIFLLGASVNTSTSPAFPNIRPSTVVPPVRRIPVPATSTTRVHRTSNHITLENAWLQFTAEMQSGPRLENLQLVPFAREILSSGSSMALISVLGDNGRAEPMQLKSCHEKTGTGGIIMEFCWSLADPEHELALGMDVMDTGSIRLTPILHNQSSQPWMASLRCPQIQGCRIVDIADDRWFLLGTGNGVLSHMPISIQREHGTHWPLPLFDLFAKQAGGGLGVYLDAWDVFPKTFMFAQSDAGTDLAIQFHDLVVPPRQSLTLPPVVLMAHVGDWHDLFNAYRGRVAARMPSDSGKRIQDIFACRRDYPLGGTGYLFDPLPRHYTPRRLAAESNQAFGGIDMIDISGWAYSLTTGRVGDYLSNDLGGLDELRRMVEQSHADGARVGLYFEGYLLDRRSDIAKKALPNWQMIDKDGQPLWWSGGMEFYACPGVEAWRNALAGMIAEVAAATGADAVYVDQYGLLGPNRTCWSPDHGHPVPSHPIREERAMLQAIRHALDQKTPNVAIYIEYTPPDCMMDLVDAAFDYGMSDTTPPCRHAADLPLYRFAFPQLASFQMISSGIRPIPVEPDDLHRCLFHGLGIWMKGRAESWYSPETRNLAQQAYRIFKDHADAFRSRQCDPMIPTLQPNLYANRFMIRDRIILTMYNASYGTIAGDLVQIAIPRDWTITGLLPKNRVDMVRNVDQIILRGTVNPHTTAVFLLEAP